MTEATTSPGRQPQACRELCEQRGYEVIGVAGPGRERRRDNAFDRPEPGGGCVSAITRSTCWSSPDGSPRQAAARSGGDDPVGAGSSNRIGKRHRVFPDLTQPFGDIIALLVAKVAEMELAAIAT